MDEIRQIKEKYGQESKDIIANGLNLRNKGKRYHCPNIHAHKNGDKNPSMSWDPKALQFYCFTCGMKIDLYGYYRDHLNYTHQEITQELLGKSDYASTEIQKNRNSFTEEVKKVEEITQPCIDYIKLRGITEETIKIFNIGTYKNQIAFPYYKFETIIGYKLRKPMKNPGIPKMTNITGSKPFLFNFQNIDLDNKELIICEGEFDCMVIHQCGFHNVVSVGAGAKSLKALIEQAKDFLNQFLSLIIVSDNDDAGREMDESFVKEFGKKAKLIDKKLYQQVDINEEYVLYGKSKVADLVESGRFKVEGRRDLEQQPYKGLPKDEGRYIPTGISQIDYALNDLSPKRLTLITGRSNGGKTTLVKQIIANAIDKGNKVYWMNGENDADFLLNDFYQVVIGRNEDYYTKVQINKRTRKEPKPNIMEKLQKWHYKKLTLFNKGESKLKLIGELVEMLETEIKFNQYDLIVIDNLMSVLSVDALQKNEQQADFVQILADLSKNYNTHIILVLHPNKTYTKGSEMDFEQISGSSDMYNKADNIIAVNREYDKDKQMQGINGYINILKNRYYPELPTVETYYDKETGLLLERNENGDVLAYTFRFNDEIPEGFQIVVGEKVPWD